MDVAASIRPQPHLGPFLAEHEELFWHYAGQPRRPQVAGQVTIGANAHFEGILLAKTAITLVTGATMNGRALSQTQIALQQATLTQP